MVILQPSGGLCNRMRAITAGLELAERKGTKIIILWKCKSELNAPFNKLFKPIKGVKVISYHSSKDIREKFFKRISKIKLENPEIRESMNRGNGELDREIEDKIELPIYLWTCEQFYHADKYFELFQPTDRIEKSINKILGHLSSSELIGVHIRRTDQIDSIKHSKTENFVELMNKEINKNPNVMFYLATDDMTEEAYLRKLFPERIVSNENRTLSRDSQDGICDAVIDLYCLSHCGKIIGSYWSSFTDVAAILGKCKKIIAGVDEGAY